MIRAKSIRPGKSWVNDDKLWSREEAKFKKQNPEEYRKLQDIWLRLYLECAQYCIPRMANILRGQRNGRRKTDQDTVNRWKKSAINYWKKHRFASVRQVVFHVMSKHGIEIRKGKHGQSVANRTVTDSIKDHKPK